MCSVSCIMMHETSAKALSNYMKETFRLLKPGGIGLHMDFPNNEDKTPYMQAMVDWNTHYNAEPFIGTLGDIDLINVAVKSGFPRKDVLFAPMSRFIKGSHMHILDVRKLSKQN